MEALTLNGLPTLLFLAVPPAARLADLGRYRAVGIAGVGRSQPPDWMDRELPALFEGLRAAGAPLIQYKTCSTFDSAPQIGSIGRAIDIGQRICGSPIVPLVVGAPALRRYSVFGNLFATVDGATHRLDRHPTMAHHPVTPMTEADLRRHLARQTGKTIALVDILDLAAADVDARVAAALAARPDVVVCDVLDEASLAEVGRQIWRHAAAPQFIADSSGVEYALVAHWLLPDPERCRRPRRPIGSALGQLSPVTAR